jgi:DNA-binding beta-propeller fold protein YncE
MARIVRSHRVRSLVILLTMVMILASGSLAASAPLAVAAQDPEGIPEEGPYYAYAISAQASVGEVNHPVAAAAAGNRNVYVVDTGNHRIQRFSADGQFLGQWGSLGEREGQFFEPTGIVVAWDGTVYVVDSGNSRIQYFSAEGKFLGSWGKRGSTKGEFIDPTAVGIKPDPSGSYVYVTDTGNRRVQYFTLDGNYRGEWKDWSEPGSRFDAFSMPVGVLVAPNGYVYVSDARRQRIVYFDALLPGQFNEPWHLASDKYSNVFVADSGNQRVQIFSEVGVFLKGWGSRGTLGGEFSTPRGVAVRQDDSYVFVADTDNNRVQCFKPRTTPGVAFDFEFAGEWAFEGRGEQQFNSPEGVAVAPADRTVYVADTRNNRIRRIKATGEPIAVWGRWGNGDGEFISPTDVAVANNGTVYVVDRLNHRIQRFAATGAYQGQWGTRGQSLGQFELPEGVAVAADGNVYVADTGNRRVQRFGPLGQNPVEWKIDGSPADVAIAPDGNVYVLDRENCHVLVYTAAGAVVRQFGSCGSSQSEFSEASRIAVSPVVRETLGLDAVCNQGEFLRAWGSYGQETNQFDRPMGVAVAGDGILYVADADNHRIQLYLCTDRYIGMWHYPDAREGQFMSIAGVAVGPNGHSYIVDDGRHRVQFFSPGSTSGDAQGLFLGQWGSQGSERGEFESPQGVAVGGDGAVYVADTLNHRIQVFGPIGKFLRSWGSRGTGNGQFNSPASIAVTGNRVYVADAKNSRIQYFDLSGSYLGQWPVPPSDLGQPSNPWDIEILPDGSLAVIDTSNCRVLEFTAEGALTRAFGSCGSAAGQMLAPKGLAVVDGENASILAVADTGNNRIVEFSLEGAPLGQWGAHGVAEGEFRSPDDLVQVTKGPIYVADSENARLQAFLPEYSMTWRYEYFGNGWMTRNPVLIAGHEMAEDSDMVFDWGAGSPDPILAADDFSLRFQGPIFPETPGWYIFNIKAQGAVRIWVDDKIVFESWRDTTAGIDTSVLVPLSYRDCVDARGNEGRCKDRIVRVEYAEEQGPASLELSWENPYVIPPRLWLPLMLNDIALPPR